MLRFAAMAFASCLALALGACGSVPPANLAAATFPVIAVERVPVRQLAVRVSPDAVTRREYGAGTGGYLMPYALGDVEQHYARGVATSVLPGAQFGGPRAPGVPELRLMSFSHGMFAHTSGSIPDVTDEVTARWVLLDGAGVTVARYVFVGARTAATGMGTRSEHHAMAQARGVAAIDDLYRKTVAGLAAARADFARVQPP